MILIPDLQFKPLFETAPGLNLVLVPDFTITAASDAYLHATMTEREAIIGRNLFDVFPDNPDDNNATGVLNLRASLNYVLEHGKPHTMAVQKYDVRRRDGTFEERYWLPVNTPVFNSRHQVSHIIHNVEDVTASVKANNQLKKNEQDFQLLVNNVKDYAIFLLDKNGFVASWNKGAENIKGYTAAEIIGKPIEIFYNAEDIRQGIPQKNLQITLQNGRLETEGWRVRKDGSLFYANIVFTSLVDDTGNHYGFAKVTKDITEKRKDEERIRQLASITSNMQDPVITSDKDFNITRWNDAAEKLLGWKSEEVMGKTTVDVLKTIYQFQPREQVIASIAANGIWQGELIYHAKSGRPVNVIATASKLLDANGDQTGNLILVKDITERKKVEEALSKLNEELECKVQERTEAIKRSEKQYRYLFENNPMPMWVMDISTFQFLDVNEVALLHYGYSRREFLSMTALDIRPDADKIRFINSDHAQGITATNYNKGVWPHKKKNGDIIQVEIIAQDIIFEGTAARLILANDVTEKKKTEDKLAASENLFRALIENSNDIITLMDDSFQLIYRSPAAVRITGWTNEGMLGLDATKNIHPDDRLYAAAIVTEVMANPAKTINTIFRMRHKQGHYIWVEGTFNNLLQDKYVKAIVFNFRNVTERVEAEEKLASSETRFRSLIENSAEGITLTDPSFNTFYRSPSALKIIGEDSLADLTKRSHPEDLEKLVQVRMKSLSNPGLPISFEGRFALPSGGYHWLEGTLTNLFHLKGVEAVVANFRDITQRKEAEEKLTASEKQFRNTLDNMLEGIQIHDFNWRYTYVNDALAKYSKTSKDKLIGYTLMDKFPGIEQTPLFKTLAHCMSNRVSEQLETEFIFPDGSKGFYQLSIQPVPEGIFILSIDISKRKQAEQEVIRSEENLKAIFDNTTEGFILTDVAGKVKVYNSRALESILQNMQGKIKIGQSIFEIIQQERKDFFKTIFSKVISGQTIQYNRCYTSSNGQLTWIDFIFTPVISNGQINGICVTGRDITTEKIAEQQKDFDRSNLNALINNTGDVMWSIDRNFKLITSNQAFNKRMENIYGKIPEAGSNIFKTVKNEAERLQYELTYNRAFNGESFTEVVHHKTPDDTWIEISFNPIYKDDYVIGTACFSRDITERKKAEVLLKKNFEEKKSLATRMSAILNTLPANIALLDKKGFIVDVNDSWRHFAIENDFNGAGYGVGNNYLTISKNAKGDGEKVAAGIKAVLENKAKEFVFEYPCHSPGQERWFRMITTPMHEKKHSGAVVMHIDISQLRRLEQARLKSNMEEQKRITLAILQGQEKERNHIGKELHDNVNQILAGTKLFLTSAAHKNEMVKELIKYPIELLNSSIEEIRLLCRNLVSPIKNIDLEELAKGLLAHCPETVNTTLTYAVPKRLLSDDLKLNIYRIMQELVNNTMKYAEAKNISIAVRSEDKELCIIVSDDGKGFDVKNKREGIGISNIINRVESFDGNLEIQSSPGKGCKTVIIIPC